MAKTYAQWNADDKQSSLSLSGSNLIASDTADDWSGIRSDIGVSSGKWYWEITITTRTNDFAVGVANRSAHVSGATSQPADNGAWAFYSAGASDKYKWHAGSGAAYGAQFVSGDVIGIALDLDGGTVEFFKNGSSQGVAYSTGLTGQPMYAWFASYQNTQVATANFGASAFAYSVPSGFNSGLYTDGNHTLTVTASNDEITAFGKSTTFQQIADWFETGAAGTVSAVKVSLKNDAGSPSDNVVVAIQADSGGVPSGTDLATGSIAAASLSGTITEYTVTLGSPVSLSARTKYWCIVRRSGSLSDVNYYRNGGWANPTGYTGNDGQRVYNGTNWSNSSGNLGSNHGIAHIIMDVSTSTAYTKELTETVTYTDSILKSLSRSFVETITHTDTFTSLRTAFATLTETITHTDVLAKTATKVFSETVTLTDSLLRATSRAFTETITFTDTLIKSLARSLVETITHTDSILKQTFRTFTETVTYTDVISYTRIYFKELTETITHTDVFESLRTAFKELSETLTLTDTLVRQATKLLSETVTFTDTVIREISRMLTETLTLTDTVLKSIARSLTETITFTDTMTRTFFKVLSDTVSMTDSLIRQTTKQLLETLTLTDVVNRFLARTLTETLTMTDSVQKQVYRVLSDSVAFSDTLIRQTTKVLADTLTFTDTLTTRILTKMKRGIAVLTTNLSKQVTELTTKLRKIMLD